MLVVESIAVEQPRCPSAQIGPVGSRGKCPPRPRPVGRDDLPAVDHQPVADAGTRRHHGEVVDPAPETEPALRLRQRHHVVLDHDRQPFIPG